MKIVSVKRILFLISLLLSCKAYAENIDFYGIASKDADKNMLSMTENIYFTQLNELNVSLSDKRSDFFSENYFSSGDQAFSSSAATDKAFFAVISKQDSSKWLCKLNLKNIKTGKVHTVSREYDSFYKIMMESKTTLNELFTELINPQEESIQQATSALSLTTEYLSGTWSAKDSTISKILILRGGRGFVIFKNGASMNISVKIDLSENNEPIAVITQTSSNNASYFPDLDRKLAMDLALQANSVTWKLKLVEDGKLSGAKETFVKKAAGAEWSETPAEWTKIQ